MKKILLFIAFTSLFASCEDQNENEDVVQQPDKNGSIETIVSVTHGSGIDILSTTHKVWVKGVLDKTITKIDTLKSLGTTKEEGEDSDGNTKDITVSKDYELYITVK